MKASCLCGGVTYEITGPVQRARYCHCANCGIPLGVLDDDGVPRPEMHVWMKSAVPWESISDGLPQHETHP